jgi:hypothetical protein
MKPGYYREPANCRQFYTCKEVAPGSAFLSGARYSLILGVKESFTGYAYSFPLDAK